MQVTLASTNPMQVKSTMDMKTTRGGVYHFPEQH